MMFYRIHISSNQNKINENEKLKLMILKIYKKNKLIY